MQMFARRGSYGNNSGYGNSGQMASAELYDPDSGSWTPTGNMVEARYGDTATLLPDGTVLVAGGSRIPDVYDPVAGTFVTAFMQTTRGANTATSLPSGKVLLTAGATISPSLPGRP